MNAYAELSLARVEALQSLIGQKSQALIDKAMRPAE
jgi:hypothetical protein